MWPPNSTSPTDSIARLQTKVPRFHADEGSVLHYDPTPLRQQLEEEKPISPIKETRSSRRSRAVELGVDAMAGGVPMRSPQLSRHPSGMMHGMPTTHPGVGSFDPHFGGMPVDRMHMHMPPTPMSVGPMSAGPMSAGPMSGGAPGFVPSGQFYSDTLPSPMRSGSMHAGMMPPNAYSPMHEQQRRMTRGMSGGMMQDGYPPMYGP
jgi:hypothetical protein